jgi:hypothetical protein
MIKGAAITKGMTMTKTVKTDGKYTRESYFYIYSIARIPVYKRIFRNNANYMVRHPKDRYYRKAMITVIKSNTTLLTNETTGIYVKIMFLGFVLVRKRYVHNNKDVNGKTPTYFGIKK